MLAIRFYERMSWLIVVAACWSCPCFAQDKAADKPKPVFVPKITIGKETTWATEPVGPSGFIDYLAVVNQRHSGGVTSENNAVVPLYRALGPRPAGGNRRPDQFFQLLGIEPLPDDGEYFVDLSKWWELKEKPLPEGGLGAVYELQKASHERPWKAKEFPETAEWLRDNEVPLRLVAEAVERPEYFSPLVSENGEQGKMIAVLLPGVQSARSIARALTARAMLRLSEGNDFEAWRDLIVIHRLGRLIGRGPTLIEGLVGIAIESMAIDAELRFLSEAQPPTKFVTRYLKQINSLPARSLMADKIDVGERAMYLDCCHHLARGSMNLDTLADEVPDDSIVEKLIKGAVSQSVDWDEILKSGNRWYDRLVTASRTPAYREREVALRKLDDELKELTKKRQGAGALLALLGGKAALTQTFSDTLISLLTPAVRQCIKAENRLTQRLRNLEVALALSSWRSEHEAYPASLTDLAPKYLAVVPNDLFNDRPLHYARTAEGYVFYSVGDNEKDDEGRSFDDMPAADDLVVRMPKPLPKADR